MTTQKPRTAAGRALLDWLRELGMLPVNREIVRDSVTRIEAEAAAAGRAEWLTAERLAQALEDALASGHWGDSIASVARETIAALDDGERVD